MTALDVATIVFACVSAGVLFGMLLSKVLPKDHLSNDAYTGMDLNRIVQGRIVES